MQPANPEQCDMELNASISTSRRRCQGKAVLRKSWIMYQLVPTNDPRIAIILIGNPSVLGVDHFWTNPYEHVCFQNLGQNMLEP